DAAARLEKALTGRTGVPRASIDPTVQLAEVTYDPEHVSPDDIIRWTEAAGYEARFAGHRGGWRGPAVRPLPAPGSGRARGGPSCRSRPPRPTKPYPVSRVSERRDRDKAVRRPLARRTRGGCDPATAGSEAP